MIFTSSVHQVIPWAGHANSAAAKGGLRLLMETMAQELAGEKIRVNAIAPGAIKTSINKDAWSTEAALQKLIKLIPYGRIGEPEDVGKAAVWLASDEADYEVGTTLFVDGGMLLYPAFREGGYARRQQRRSCQAGRCDGQPGAGNPGSQSIACLAFLP